MNFLGKKLKNGLAMLSAFAMMITAVAFCFSDGASVHAATEGKVEVNNPIIWADVPDDDVIRVGDTYYMVSTTMFFSPGAPIMKSKDLVSWEICSYVYDRLAEGDVQNLTNGKHDYAHGQWAASLRYNKGTFYVFFGSYGTNKSYIFKTNDIESGNWTRSEINGMYHDASILFDDDGRNYLVFGGGGDIKIKELNSQMTGFANGATERSLFKTGLTNLAGEGSHIQKINGYYYVFIIAWPNGSGRIELCYRSKSLTGYFEGKTVLNSGLGTYGSGVAQGGIVDTPDGKWYGLLFQDHGAVGRIPALVPVTWQNDWPMMGVNGKAPVTIEVDGGYNGTFLAKNDEFSYSSNKLALEWQWNHNPDNQNWSVTQRDGYLRLKNGTIATNILNARNTLTQRTEGPSCSSVIKIDTTNMKVGDYAGLSAFQLKYGNVGVYVANDGSRKVYMAENGGSEIANSYNKIVEEKNLSGNEVYLKAEFNYGTVDSNHNISNNIDKANFFFSYDGNSWTKIGSQLSMTYDLKLFTGYRSGIFSYATKQTGGYVDVDFFHYQRGVWNTPVAPVNVEPDENGYYLNHDFESAAAGWQGRGGASVSVTSSNAYSGDKALYVTDRTAVWNGAMMSLNKSVYKPGNEYCFSANVKYLDGEATEDFRMTLEYKDPSGETNYDHIDTKKAVKGEYVHLYNPNYKIPDGAYDMVLVLETVDQTVNFYIDDVGIAVAGKQIDGPGEIKFTYGDLNDDGNINIVDFCLEKSVVLGETQDTIACQAGDVDKSGQVDAADLIIIRSYCLGMISEF